MNPDRLLAWTAATRPDLVLLCEHSPTRRIPRTHTPLRLPTCVTELPDHAVPEILLAGARSLALVCEHSPDLLDALGPLLSDPPTGGIRRRADEVSAEEIPVPRRALLGLPGNAGIDTSAPDDVRLATALRLLGVEFDRPTSASALHADGCTACSVCVTACPSGALALIGEDTTDLVHDRTSCTSCMRCVRLCPPGALSSAGSISLRTLSNYPQVSVETMPTAHCERCAQLFRSEGEPLCPTCAFRRATPFGSVLPR